MKFDIIPEIASLAVSAAALAVISPDQETRVLCFCIIGSAVGGVVGVELFSNALSKREKIWRYVTNFCTGIFAAPAAAESASGTLPEMNINYLALLSGGAVSCLGVLLLGIAVPALIKWTKDKVNTTTNSRIP